VTVDDRPVVVLAEDDDDIRLLVQLFLVRAGCRVLATGDGSHAWNLIARERPAFAILDIAMPGMTGLEVTRAVRTELGRELPIVLLTANVHASDVQLGLKTGADAYIRKPFGGAELRRTIADLLARVGAPVTA